MSLIWRNHLYVLHIVFHFTPDKIWYLFLLHNFKHRKYFSIRRVLVLVVDHLYEVGAAATMKIKLDKCCSNFIFILDLTLGFNGLSKDNCSETRCLCLGIWCLLYYRFDGTVVSLIWRTSCYAIFPWWIEFDDIGILVHEIYSSKTHSLV